MTTADLLEALQQAQPTEAGEGCTVIELMAAMGKGDDYVRKALRAGIAAGTVRPARKYITAINGTRQPVASYVLVSKGKKAA